VRLKNGLRRIKMEGCFNKLTMETYETGCRGRKITDNIDDAIWVHIPDEETAEQLSEWSKANNYPAFVNCEVGHYHWDDENEIFYKEY
jgi:hypothetical protein